MEVYYPRRIGQVCYEYNLGPALDLRTGYDFTKAADRVRAVEIYKAEQPEMVMLCPPCTEFFRLQAMNRLIHCPEYCKEHDARKAQVVKHEEFSIQIAKMQLRNGTWFVFEHPAHGDTWHEECMKRLLNTLGVDWRVADQCQY